MDGQLDQLHLGIEAAKSGRVKEARQNLEQAVVNNPKDLLAWAWLSEIREDLESRIDALERALAIQSGNSSIQEHLDLLKEEKTALQADLQQAARLLKSGARLDALQILRQITLKYPYCERAWFIHSYAEPVMDDQLKAIERVLAINPGNQRAKTARMTSSDWSGIRSCSAWITICTRMLLPACRIAN
jgi:tetratricopeptide (TPR) repeat protein